MAFAPMLPYMAGGFAVDKLMGGTGMTGLALGTGLSGIGGFSGLAGELGLSGVSAIPSAATANSLGAGAGLMSGVGTAASGVASSLLPAVETTGGLIGSTTTPEYANLVMTNSALPPMSSYAPITDAAGQAVAPNMSGLQSMPETPYFSGGNFGTAQTPNYVNSAMTTDPTKQMNSFGLDTATRDINGNFDSLPQFPDFNNITKSSAEEIKKAEGGYEKPLYERAFDSVMGFAEQNPLAVASLGLTAFDKANPKEEKVPVPSVGAIRTAAYNPAKKPILTVRRAT